MLTDTDDIMGHAGILVRSTTSTAGTTGLKPAPNAVEGTKPYASSALRVVFYYYIMIMGDARSGTAAVRSSRPTLLSLDGDCVATRTVVISNTGITT
jgi:hypothetical protein